MEAALHLDAEHMAYGLGHRAAFVRAVPMADTVLEAARRRLKDCAPNEMVFCGPGGSNRMRRGVRSELTIGNYRRVYKRAGERAQLRHLALHGPYDLRHTFATWLEDAGIPARVIDELMGHGAIAREGSAVGQRYCHTTPEMEARVVAAIEERLKVALEVCAEVERWPASPTAVPEGWVLPMCCPHRSTGGA